MQSCERVERAEPTAAFAFFAGDEETAVAPSFAVAAASSVILGSAAAAGGVYKKQRDVANKSLIKS